MSYMAYGSSPPPTRKPGVRSIALSLVLGLIAAFLLVGCVALMSGLDPSRQVRAGIGAKKDPGVDDATETTRPAPRARIGDKVTDGRLTFVVLRKRTARTFGEGFLRKRAKGVFVILTVRVTNRGRKARVFEVTNQFLYDGGGRRYDAESGALLVDNDAFVRAIRPGRTATGWVAFDVPRRVTPVSAELHESTLSDGVAVELSEPPR
jgi:hypothetical protein